MNILRFRTLEWGVAIIVVFLPLLVKVLFNLPWLMLQDFTDGVFYLGYAMQFGELLGRLGLHYYAVRFSGFLPDALAFSLLGVEWGFILVRYALAGACCFSLYLLFLKRYSLTVGIFAAVAWAFNPAAIRLLQTAYVDVAGTSFLCIGVAILAIPRIGVFMASVGGGILALAFWSHLHAAVALFFLLPLLMVSFFEQGIKKACLLGVSSLLGFLVVTGSGCGFYYWQFGVWDMSAPTRELLAILNSGTIPAPRLSWTEMLEKCPFWLAVLPLSLAICFLPNRDRFLYGAWFAACGYVGCLWVGDVVNGGYSLSLFYYFSFALPAIVLLFTASAAPFLTIPKNFRHLYPLLAAILLPVFSVGWNFSASLTGILATVLIALLPACITQTPRFIMAATCFFAATFAISIAPSSHWALGNYWKTDDFPILTMAQQLSKALPSYQDSPQGLAFWYDDEKPTDLRMLQFFYLHEFSKFKDESGANIPFPPKGNVTQQTLQTTGIRTLVILGNTQAEVELGLNCLKTATIRIDHIEQLRLQSKDRTIFTAIVTLATPAFSSSQPVANEWQIFRKAKQQRLESGAFALESYWIKGNPDAWLALPAMEEGEFLTIRLQVKRGFFQLEFAESFESQAPGISHLIAKTDIPIEIIVTPPRTTPMHGIRLKNFAPNGVRSKVEVLEVRRMR